MNARPLAIDLFCGLGGFTEGLLAEGFKPIGFDIEAHDFGDGKRYPAQLVLQDVLTLHGRQFKDAALIVASPPCQFFSYCAMPWSRAKKLAAEVRASKERTDKELALFRACFRIQREAIEAAGHFIPMVVENVRGAQPWVGRSNAHFGSFHLWGDIPALMPITQSRRMKSAISCAPRNFSDRIAGQQAEGVKGFTPSGEPMGKNVHGRTGSKSNARKAASAQIAKIPFALSSWIARVWKPRLTT